MATYTLAEVEKHKDSQSGVWMVIHGKVYDVSKFLDEVSIVDHLKSFYWHYNLYNY